MTKNICSFERSRKTFLKSICSNAYRHNLFFYIVIIALVLFVFHNILKNGFVFDDEHFIVKNRFLYSFSFLKEIFTTNIIAGSGFNSNLYRPFQTFTHLLDMRLWGLDPRGHHLTNLLLHISASLSFFHLLKTKFASGVALIVTLIFCLHPLQSESVAYISGRGDILAIFLMCQGLIWFDKSIVITCVCAALAMMSKESLALFPCYLFLFELLRGKTILWRRHIWAWGVTALYCFLRLTLLNFKNIMNFYDSTNVFTENFSYRFYTYLSTIPKTLMLWLAPYDLHHERSWHVYSSFLYPGVCISALVILVALVVAFKYRKRMPILLISLAWFFIASFPTSNLLVIINALIYDHWFIIPGMAFMFLFAVALTAIVEKSSVLYSKGIYVLMTVIIGAMIIVTPKYNAVWEDPISLYGHILKFEPKSAKSHNNIAMEYADRGNYMEAIEHYKAALKFNNKYPQTHHNLAGLYLDLEEYDLAIAELEKALRVKEDFFPSLVLLGKLKFFQGNYQQAKKYFTRAIDANPTLQGQLAPFLRKIEEM